MGNNFLDNLKPKTVPPNEGYVWLNILIKYDYKKGTSQVIRSFSKPAKDSTIKSLVKPKKEKVKVNVNRDKPTEKKSLFN